MPGKKAVLAGSVAALGVTLFAFLHFLTFNESRSGFAFNDPVLRMIRPLNFSGITFFITYLFCISGIVIALQTPHVFIRMVQAYTLMTLLRMLSLYVLPLDPPPGIIPLKDLFLQSSFYSGRDNLRDLFFSGHTTTLFMFAFALEKKRVKIMFALAAAAVGCLLIWQHVHYSIDVAAAPVIAYAVVRICK